MHGSPVRVWLVGVAAPDGGAGTPNRSSRWSPPEQTDSVRTAPTGRLVWTRPTLPPRPPARRPEGPADPMRLPSVRSARTRTSGPMSVLDLRCTHRRRPGTVVAGVGLPTGASPGQRGRTRDGSGLAIEQRRVGSAGPGGVEVLRHSEPVHGVFERVGMLGLGRIYGWRQCAGSRRTWLLRCAGRGLAAAKDQGRLGGRSSCQSCWQEPERRGCQPCSRWWVVGVRASSRSRMSEGSRWAARSRIWLRSGSVSRALSRSR
jgi:hypothetical protein